MYKSNLFFLFILFSFAVVNVFGQNILPRPTKIKNSDSELVMKNELQIAYDEEFEESAIYLLSKLENYFVVRLTKSGKGDIELKNSANNVDLGEEGYKLLIDKNGIFISANTNSGSFYAMQSLLQLFPAEIQAGVGYQFNELKISCLEVVDRPKYSWRSFMLDSGRQYQSPEFIKKYLRSMAMLKMNVFHWHLTEGMGWRIEIKKYPKLTSIGSKIMDGPEQQGYYTQKEIKEIVEYARKLNITVVPEIDVPGHSEAALIAYPEMSCFDEAPVVKEDYTFTHNLLCGGSEQTYQFLENILDEVCQLFPSEYIHLGGDEAPKQNWDECADCQKKIEEEKLQDTQDLQLYFSARLAEYLKTKNRKAVFWGDVVYHEGTTVLPENSVVQWWNWIGKQDLALKNAIERGHLVICNSSKCTYLNYPHTPWEMYKENKTFDLKEVYENNPSDIDNPNDLVLGMGTCLWTNCGVVENMVDMRVFPRIYAISEQMWSTGNRLGFDDFYTMVKSKYKLLELINIDYGPALKEDVPENFSWER